MQISRRASISCEEGGGETERREGNYHRKHSSGNKKKDFVRREDQGREKTMRWEAGRQNAAVILRSFKDTWNPWCVFLCFVLLPHTLQLTCKDRRETTSSYGRFPLSDENQVFRSEFSVVMVEDRGNDVLNDIWGPKSDFVLCRVSSNCFCLIVH